MWALTRRDSWKETVRYCVVLGAACAVITASLGWCEGAVSHYGKASAQILGWHRWLGTATAVWAVFVAMLSQYSHETASPARGRSAFRLSLLVGIFLVSVAGYLGASLIYGLNHFTWFQTIRNKKLLQEKDPAVRQRNHDELRRAAADPKLAREFLLRTSLIDSVREAARIT